MTATCLHCRSDCRLTDGAEVYPHRQDLHDKPIYVCDPCSARVGCHPGTQNPLGYAADARTRSARMRLHNERLDPLWKNCADKKTARRDVYRFLTKTLGIEADDCHTGKFTIERCRDAWRALAGQTPETIRAWNAQRRDAAQESRTDQNRKRRGRRRRRASRNDLPPITGRHFDPVQAARSEVPW